MTRTGAEGRDPGMGTRRRAARDGSMRDLLARAYRFSEQAHRGQKRSSGEPYVSALRAGGARSSPSCSSTRSPSPAGSSTMSSRTRRHARRRREGVRHRDRRRSSTASRRSRTLPSRAAQERQVENYRKLLLSIAKDVRVIIDQARGPSAQHAHAGLPARGEAAPHRAGDADLYAPLAHRFGMAKVRWELEDLAFKYLEPEEYKALAKKVAAEARRARGADRADGGAADARPQGGGDRGRRGGRPAEAPLVDLQEDEAAREAVRGDLRPHGDARDS